jgi:hypothetical protein
VNTPETGKPLVNESPAHRAPRVTRMLTWAGAGGLRLEAARLILSERGLRASGSLTSTRQEGTEAYFASYSLTTDKTGVAKRLAVRTTRVHGEHYLTLTRSEEGIWLIDHQLDRGTRTIRTPFSGALDVELTFSPLFTTLPLRRLGPRITAQHDLAVVSVSLPGLEVDCVRQTYRTVSVGEPTVVSFTSHAVTAELTMDTDGLLIDHPGVAHRA